MPSEIPNRKAKKPMDLATLAAEDARLNLASFDEATALKLGMILLDLARKDALPVVINIRTANRTLFHAALPGSVPLGDVWARRKSATALLIQASSMMVGLRNAEKGRTLAIDGLDEANYADHGGAVPIRVKGVGMVAVATVSGLPQVEDHRLVVKGIEALIAAMG